MIANRIETGRTRVGVTRWWGVVLLAAGLLLVVAAWWALGGYERAPEMTAAEAQQRIDTLAERFDAALQNDRDASPLLPEVERLSDAFPQLADGHRLLGQLHSHHGDLHAALEAFDTALRVRSGDGQLHLLAGGVAEHLEQLTLAESHYRSARDVEPDEPEHIVRLANIAIKTERWDEAESLLQEALDRDPGLHEAHALTASVQSHRGDADAALRSVERAYELVQNQGGEPLRKYAMRLASMLRERGEPALAAKMLRLSEPQDFFRTEIMAAYADALGAAGLPLGAAQNYELWLQREPANAQAAAEGARWYLRAGEPDAARAMLVVLRRIDPRHAELPALERTLRETLAE